MKSRRKIGFAVIAAACGLFATTQIASAQSTDTKSQQHQQPFANVAYYFAVHRNACARNALND